MEGSMKTASLFAFLPLILAGCGSVTPKPSAVKAPPPTVVFLGDSVTYNWKSFDPADWTANASWNNQGVIGQNSSQLLGRFTDDVVSQHPDVVHILTGTNDVYPGWQLCGGSPVFDTCDNIKQMVALARAANIKIILGTIPPWETDPVTVGDTAWNADNSAARYARIQTLNQWISSYGFAQGIPVVDYHSLLVAADGEHYIPALTVDGVHPSLAGYELMTPAVESAIQEAIQ
jgi:lysophospholipase L1-like esterase